MRERLKTADEEVLMLQLRDILLHEDRAKLEELQEVLSTQNLLAQRIDPIIEAHLTYLKANFPDNYERVVDKLIETKLKDSQQEIIDIIYPMLGRMIAKYINHQFQQLKDGINEQLRKMLPNRTMMWRLRNRILGISDADMVLANISQPVLDEIFVIQRDSGLLLGSASLHEKTDREAVAGMLTAIKAFAEDAFEREAEDLEEIQYGTHRILLQGFPSFYFALVLRGAISAREISDWKEKISSFAEQNIELRSRDVTDQLQNRISQMLNDSFLLDENQKPLLN
ncbi:MAG: hypothetical protein HC817_10005 [Saprospiraceae bacterium]|nr:hypothetical protein [Saprospiraceae bacterium]